MQSASLQLPVVFPVYQQQTDGSYELEMFVETLVNVAQIRGVLDQGAVHVLCALKDWVGTAFLDSAPCCLVLDRDAQSVTALFYTGRKTFSSLGQCLSKMRLSKKVAPGCVVRVEGNVFVRSYSAIVSYVLDPEARLYQHHSTCSIPSKMHHCAWSALDTYSLLCVVQGLREQQIESMTRSFRVLAVATGGDSAVTKYRFNCNGPGMLGSGGSSKARGSKADHVDAALEVCPEVDACHEGPQDAGQARGGYGATVTVVHGLGEPGGRPVLDEHHAQGQDDEL